jgi:type II secretory pathway component PulJ
MIARLRDERGMTLVELLIGMIISLVVFGATLSVAVAMNNGAKRNADHNEAQDTARTYIDRLARQLRNLASPSIFTDDYQAQPYAVDSAGPYDLVFRVVDDKRPGGSLNHANVKRVRYCLNSTDPSRGVLYQNRPLFVFNATDLQRISQIHADLYIDPTPGEAPVESRLGSGVTLRNQNRVPVARMDIAPAPGKLVLNGSASEDPEGMPLTYQWYLNPPTPLPDCSATPLPPSCVGQGVVLDVPIAPATSHRIVLVVRDPAGLPARVEDNYP